VNRVWWVALAILATCCCGGPHSKYPVVKTDGPRLKILLKDVRDGKVHFFSFVSGKRSLDFFVRMDGADKLHACFDACFTCYKFKKGYRVDGTDLVCNECGTKFRLADETWKDVMGCVPVAIPSVAEGDYLTLSVADLQRGERLF